MKTIIIVDDDAIVRESLKMILESKHYKVLASASTADEAVNLYFKQKPDIVLMDIRMSGSTGLDASKKILSKDKYAKILLLTTFHDKEYIDEAIALGCRGYILKENISSINATIEAVLNGNIVFDSKIVSTIGSTKKSSDSIDLSEIKELSDKEKSILELVANGKNNKEIASELYLSEGTVRNYISLMLSKLELRDRTQLAVYYYKGKIE